MSYDLSIAISSYNRDDKVAKTLATLYESDLSGIGSVEVIVIDDGSPKPVEEAVKQAATPPDNFDVRVIRQENAGIGATRNRGYREAACDRVLLLDDDIILPADAIKKLLDAQEKLGAAVIFGHYPFVTHSSEAVRRFAVELYGYERITEDEEFEKVDALTSGLLLLDRAKLPDRERFYRDDMTIPAAEEHEVIARFHKLGIPIYAANHVSAIHNHELELKWLVGQQYKYGLATAEAYSKVPELTGMRRFSDLRETLDFANRRGATMLAKRAFASRAGRAGLLAVARFMERLFPKGDHNRLYGMAASAHFWGGFRDGQSRFVSQERGHR